MLYICSQTFLYLETILTNEMYIIMYLNKHLNEGCFGGSGYNIHIFLNIRKFFGISFLRTDPISNLFTFFK